MMIFARLMRLAVVALVLLIVHLGTCAREAVAATGTPQPVLVNDNRRPAGTFADGVLTLKLRAAVGLWRPEGQSGPELIIEAFGEDAGALQVPAPLLRVTEGTEIAASIRNDLDVSLRVHGLCARDGSPCAPVTVPPSEQRDVRFIVTTAGTFHYWATTTDMPIQFRSAMDTQLSGAFIVDRAGTQANADRVLVITDWTSITRDQLKELLAADDPAVLFSALKPRFTTLINGLSWPATERLTYRVDEEVRWRVVNLSSQQHPMHLHGFYYSVESLGDGLRNTAFDEAHQMHVVTQLLAPGATMRMRWRPERAGNWLFHCHFALHVSPDRRLGQTAPTHDGHEDTHAPEDPKSTHHETRPHEDHAMTGMAGMAMGITVVGKEQPAAEILAPHKGVPYDDGKRVPYGNDGKGVPYGNGGKGVPYESGVPARAMTLVMQTEAKRFGAAPAYGFVLAEASGAITSDKVPVPGPTLTLKRGEPVEITLVNRLPEATAIHWHGMELESYYDGVHGWSGAGSRVTPLIPPGESFVVRFTPPRAGTFIYHTHMHDDHQLPSGMYGALLVLEPDEIFDPAFDHVLVIGQDGPGAGGLGQNLPIVVNGTREPVFVWKAGAPHRLRLINITASDITVVSLATPAGPLTWKPVSKDGADVPPAQRDPRPAVQTIAAGETFDFEYEAPRGRQAFWVEFRTPAGRWQAQGRVTIK